MLQQYFQKYFGFNTFITRQEDVIRKAENKKTALFRHPTHVPFFGSQKLDFGKRDQTVIEKIKSFIA